MVERSSDGVRYVERLYPARWVWALTLFLGVGLGLSLSALSFEIGLATAVLSCLATAVVLVRSTPVLAVSDGTLRAGAARVPVELIGDVEALDAESMRHALGPGLDARAFLCLRGWIGTGVKLSLIDPADPVPYWLVSSRAPHRLAEAVASQRV